MGDAAGQLPQRIHLLCLQQLAFGAGALGDLVGQLGGGRLQFGALLEGAHVVLGHIFHHHQPMAGAAVRRQPPLRGAQALPARDGQHALPALLPGQCVLQVQHELLVAAHQGKQGAIGISVAEQACERGIALADLQLLIEHGYGRIDLAEDLLEPRVRLTQCFFGPARAQQAAQGRQQDVGVHRVDQVSIGTVVQAGDHVTGGDGGGRNVHHRQQLGARVRTQLAHHVEAAHVRQIDVQHHRAELRASQPVEPLLPGGRFTYAVAMVFEYAPHGIPRGCVVVHYQYTIRVGHWRPPSPRTVLPAG